MPRLPRSDQYGYCVGISPMLGGGDIMTHRIVCLGDTHFQHGHWRNADRLASMAQVVRKGLALPQLGAWIHLGDIWHAKPTDDDLEAVAEFFQRMAERAPVIALL